MLVRKVTLFLVSAILLHYAESTLPSNGDTIPEPVNGVLPSRFSYNGGTIHELNHPNARPFVANGYFLGMEEGPSFRPIFHNFPYRVYSFRLGRLVDIAEHERNRLLQSRRQSQASTSSSDVESNAFSGLPPRYFYANGALHEHGRHPSSTPIILGNFFFGMRDPGNLIYPVDPVSPFRVYSLITRRMVLITPQIRHQLLTGL